jgi:hypothetical protein
MKHGIEGDLFFVKLGHLGDILFAIKRSDGQEFTKKMDLGRGFVKCERWLFSWCSFIPLVSVTLLMGATWA